MDLVDVHCHLTSYQENQDVVLHRISSEMAFVVTSGITPSDNLESLRIANRMPNVLVTFGLNPVDLGRNKDLFDEYTQILEEHLDAVSGIGEVGLDYYWEKDESRRRTQREFFNRFIQIANDLGKPLVIHTRSAMLDTLDILEKDTPNKFFIHSFRGSLSQAKRVIDLGGFISLSTAMVRFPKAYTKLINNVPLEYILTETDSPYLSPFEGKENYPWNVRESLRMISEILEEDVELIAERIFRNAKEVFG